MKPSASRPAKVILLGDTSVGKTSICAQFDKLPLDPNAEPTVGATYVTKDLATARGTVTLHVWDTAGQERFRALVPLYLRGCCAVILVCAADSAQSIRSLDSWFELIDEHFADRPLGFLALNKIDLAPVIDVKTVEAWATDHEYDFFRTSALSNEGVDRLFQAVADRAASANLCTPEPIATGGPESAQTACC
jgi:small GTP-binding protein